MKKINRKQAGTFTDQPQAVMEAAIDAISCPQWISGPYWFNDENRRPITDLNPARKLECELDCDRLQAVKLEKLTNFGEFEARLQRPGPRIAGIDFPYGQARRFIETIGWPDSWPEYVKHAKGLGRARFRATLNAYRADRPPGNKEHRRKTDIAAGSISPQKLYGTPVGLMFFEGAPRLQESGVTIPGLQEGDPDRIVVEAYPGILARTIIGRRTYKQDTRAKQTTEQHEARRQLLGSITNGAAKPLYGLNVNAPMELADHPGGAHLDALLCAIQAGWAWTRRRDGFGRPSDSDPLEGWIGDPATSSRNCFGVTHSRRSWD